MSEVYDHVVLGCGISGIAVAHELSREGAKTLVIDCYDKPGGNHRSIDVNGYSFDSGSIFFWADNPQFSMFPGLLEQCVPVQYTLEKLSPDGTVSRYPFSIGELRSYSPWGLTRIFSSLVISKWRSRQIATAKDYMEYYLGRYFNVESGLDSYVRRFYDLDPAEIGSDFAEARMGWIRDNGSFRNIAKHACRRVLGLLSGSRRPAKLPPQAVVRPRAGFEVYYGAMVEGLRASGVDFLFNREFQAIRLVGGLYEVMAGGDTYLARGVISTIPVDIALKISDIKTNEELKSSRMITLCCSFQGDRRPSAIVLYNFDHIGSWKRLTFHSDSYGPVRDAQYMSVECICSEGLSDAERLFADFVNHAKYRNLFDGEVRLEHIFLTDYAYPVYSNESSVRRIEALSALSNFGIHSVGRQGGFEYIPHSTLIIDAIQRWRRKAA
jgi:protoporphyrinogen oxidase